MAGGTPTKRSKKTAKKRAGESAKRAKGSGRAKRAATRQRGKAGVQSLPGDFAHLSLAPAAPPKSPGFAAAAAGPVPPQPTGVLVDFVPAPGDEDVSGKSDSDLGHTVRMKAERGDGAWVFEALDAALQRRRWLRTVARP